MYAFLHIKVKISNSIKRATNNWTQIRHVLFARNLVLFWPKRALQLTNILLKESTRGPLYNWWRRLKICSSLYPASRQWWNDIPVAPGRCVAQVTLNYLPLDKMAAVSQTIFSEAFSWMKSVIFLSKFHWSVFLMVLLIITQHWVR